MAEGDNFKEDLETEDDVNDDYINDLIDRVEDSETKNLELNSAMSAMSRKKDNDNFLHVQVDTDKLLQKLEHFYRGDRLIDKEGSKVWKEQTDKKLVTFNEYGVTSMMEIISKYIDKNTTLSTYREERINEILGDLGDELVLFVLCNHVQLGMDTYFKKTKFRIMITTTLHIIESAYRKAINSKTLEELNQSRVVGQFGSNAPQMAPQIKKSNVLSRIGFNR